MYLNTDKCKVKAKDLNTKCDPSIFKFASTAEVKPLKGIIGQDRAVHSLEFGLDMENEGYNIYLSGAFGTGKTTLARDMLEKKARRRKVPPDWCYVYNFKQPDCPQALELPPGLGKELKEDLAESMDLLIKQMVKSFESHEYDFKKSSILNSFVEETNQMYLKLEEESRTYGFTISRNANGVTSIPLKNGEVLSQDDFMAMSEDERQEILKRSAFVQEKINESFRQYKELEKSVKEKIKALEQETAREITLPYFTKLLKKYGKFPAVKDYLQDMQQDVLNNLEMFTAEEDSNAMNFLRRMDKKSLLRRYQVNHLVDSSGLKNAPVVYETNPNYSNLFGQVEFESEFGILSTDFMKIKPGAVHRANGGYLVLHVYDILKNYYVWDNLKRVIKNKEIRVESLTKNLGIGNSETLQPDKIPVNIKVILIGEPIYYYLLYTHDEEFQELFKVKVDFDVEMDRTRMHIKDYARMISSVCESEGLLHFDPAAVARVVDYGSRMAENQRKLTTLFNKLVEIIYEANRWARLSKAELVTAEHVQKAIAEKYYRAAMIEEKIQESIRDDTLMINVHGKKTGELNGLAVYMLGDHMFGRPVRITAKTFMGEKGLVNIEREIHMSGSIHSKGVLTLNGYIGAQYAQDKPLSLSASLTFEQSYSGIEGDSASSAELYALLSSLSGVPFKQGIAVTGSVNQNGEIQPVGGINEKIEGFFRICQQKGLDGEQGCIIPKQNLAQLMLSDDVIEAVNSGEFTIWAVEYVDEGLEILSGIPAGKRDYKGEYPPDTLHFLVNEKLAGWNRKGQRTLIRDKIPTQSRDVLARRRRR
ncbi:Ribosomal protein S5 domain 2-type fold, subgroup [Syntrophomonas zehnderi OL-4]|uniref:endopeptidase La n=1 Tax=Syntrophomonas zehnderi OL-4 TaxID=690567 RepID=A0A0E4C921_9FIRM|nr:ATP-binding protein [Syntrophomonas zehnderi]CFX78357.1 Ribosomal protein S5 domain 2-type fold, subgroup [Syntrophomonas zehnderi OL-4]